MGRAMGETYTNAGILKKAGTGLVMDLAGAEFFLVCEELNALYNNQTADVTNHLGEPEGVAWLSPVAARTKSDMTSVIARHIYVVPYQRFCRVLAGNQRRALVKEYRPSERMAT